MADATAVQTAVAGLDLQELAGRRWFGAKGSAIDRAELAYAFPLGEGALALVDLTADGRRERYAIPFAEGALGLREATEADHVWRALAASIAVGATIPALPKPRPSGLPGASGGMEAALVCRPSRGFASLVPEGPAWVGDAEERPLGNDQSNTSVVLGERLVLKGYRRIADGLNPDLELNAVLAEEVGFPGVPRLAGYAEVVTSDGVATVAMLSEFVVGGADVYEALAEQLTTWILAPGRVTVEFATEAAEDLGRLTAALHAALARPPSGIPDLEPREATREEIRAWGREARQRLQQAQLHVTGDVADELREEAAAIAARFSVFDALPVAPRVTRIHGDLHLGQLLIAEDGYRIVDFEGEPTRPMAERRRHDSPLRDVASMLRSIDHVGRSARRRAERRNEGPVELPGLDIDRWLERARERFLHGYRDELREQGIKPAIDDDLLIAFEFAKESYEFVYAARFLPDWLWAPREGMRWLVQRFGRAP